MLYVGLDVHKEFCQASVLNDDGNELTNERFESTLEALDRFLDRFEEARFVLESTGIWEFIYEGIESRGFEVQLAHPLKVRAIAEASVKTDKIDARTLARLLRLDMVPRSYIPSRDIRDLRQRVRQRAFLVQRCTSFKNRIHAELTRNGIRRPEDMSKAFSKKHREWLRSLGIPTIVVDLDCLEAIESKVASINVELFAEYQRRPEAQLIATIPGIGFYGALLIYAEIADVRRFATPEQLCAYAGLTPTVSQSASTVRYGGVSKEGSKHLRWILIETVYIHRRFAPHTALSTFASRIERKRGKQKATTAAARKLLHIIYWMLLRGEEYHGHGSDLVLKPAALTA